MARQAHHPLGTHRDLRSLPAAAARKIAAVHTVDILRRPTDQAPPAVKTAAGFVLHKVTSADDVLLSLAPVPARRRRQVPAAIARGDIAYLATVDGEVAAWIWLSRVSHRDSWSGLRFRLRPEECYCYDLWSAERYRALGVGAFVMAALLDDLARDASLRWVYGYVDRANRANQLLTRMVFGFTTMQVVTHLCLLDVRGWQIPYTDRPPLGPCSRRR
jgi:GNAT superfamily N-acetyltransferase